MTNAATIGSPPPLTHTHADAIRAHFRSDHYTRINLRRLEHLASLGLVRRGSTVLELGAGIADLTAFFLDRHCTVTVVEGRAENVALCREQLSDDARIAAIHQADLDNFADSGLTDQQWDIVFAYGVLYHLEQPADAIRHMADACAGLLLLETCVSPDDATHANPTPEDAKYASQALRGMGCRPSRRWVYEQLSAVMPLVYCVRTQPNHDEFPRNWINPPQSRTGLHRAIFVASRTNLDPHPLLARELLMHHQPSP